MRNRIASRTGILALAAALFGAGACSNDRIPLGPDVTTDTAAPLAATDVVDVADAPELHPGRAFFPLQLGNRWVYDGKRVITMIPEGGDPMPSERMRFRVRTKLVCQEEIAGRSYVVAREVVKEGESRTRTWIRYRQDRDGLYEADVVIGTPPVCDRGTVAEEPAEPGIAEVEAVAAVREPLPGDAWSAARAAALARAEDLRRLALDGVREVTAAPEGVARGEIRRLAYPLHDGARWRIRRDPRLVARVVGRDVLNLPAGRMPAWKVRVSTPQPGDRVRFWVGRKGFLKYAVDVTVPVVDAGQVIGQVHLRERRELARYDLASPVHAVAAPESGEPDVGLQEAAH